MEKLQWVVYPLQQTDESTQQSASDCQPVRHLTDTGVPGIEGVTARRMGVPRALQHSSSARPQSSVHAHLYTHSLTGHEAVPLTAYTRLSILKLHQSLLIILVLPNGMQRDWQMRRACPSLNSVALRSFIKLPHFHLGFHSSMWIRKEKRGRGE